MVKSCDSESADGLDEEKPPHDRGLNFFLSPFSCVRCWAVGGREKLSSAVFLRQVSVA